MSSRVSLKSASVSDPGIRAEKERSWRTSRVPRVAASRIERTSWRASAGSSSLFRRRSVVDRITVRRLLKS